MRRVLVIGTGPSGFAVLNSIKNKHEVWVMDGQAEFEDSTISTRSHLALKMKFGSGHTYVDSKSLGLLDDSSYKLPISYSRGGFGEIWGNGFTPYECSELMPNASPELQIRIRRAMRDLLNIIPFSHVPSELDTRFGEVNTWSDSNSFGSLSPHPIFQDIIEKRKVNNNDGLLFGQPSLLLDSDRCTNCGLCLTGCPYGALFDPGEQINRMMLSKELDINKFIKGIVKRIVPTNLGTEVYFVSNNEEKIELFDEVILSTGPLSTALILMNSDLLPEVFEIPDSQVFYAAFLSKKRIRQLTSTKEVGQLVCYPLGKSTEDFQISFYAPTDLSRKRISQTIFPRFFQWILLPKFLSERIVPAIGFLPQEVSGKLVIKKDRHGFTISRQPSLNAIGSSNKALRRISKALRSSGLTYFRFGTQIPLPGAGFHIGASLPLGGQYVDAEGYLITAKTVRILDASILRKIPSGAHTFLSMALIRALIVDSQ